MSHHKLLSQSGLLSITVGLALNIIIYPVRSQITPSGAGTVVNPQGNQINITGGTQAGANLFHSFRDFNVDSTQVANFLSNPQIQNILTRVNGGNPSIINGLLQVTGGNSNLFLMNPAGIIFGQGASLNIPASFTATTANQIGFGNSLFNTFGDNNFSALVGNPDSFTFTNNQAGSIVNAGNLAVGNGQNISLIAGNTVNTGRLTAPSGEIQVLAVPGTNRVRLSQPGQVLSLEIVPPIDGTLRAVDLPVLLTGHDLSGIQVNPSGQVQVAGTNLPNQQGLAVASGRIDVSSSISNGGVVQVMGDRVAALNSRINANGATGGGTVRLGGEYLGGRDTGIAPAFRFNSQRTFVDRDSLIRANATVTGEGGRVIVWADQNTGYFGRITGRGATGRGGFVEISGRENLAFDGRVEISGANGLFGSLLLDPTNITIVPGVSGANDAEVTGDATILSGDTPANMTISAGALSSIPAGATINIAATGNINFNTNVNLAGGVLSAPIIFTAGTITSGTFSLNTNGRNLVMRADGINAPNLSINTSDGGVNNSGSVSLTANLGNIRVGNITSGAGVATGNAGAGGNVNIAAPLGSINILGSVDSRSVSQGTGDSRNAGDITIAAQSINVGNPSDPTTGAIAAYSRVGTGNTGNGGNIVLRATNGGITAAAITTATSVFGTGIAGNAGTIDIDATGDVNLRGGIVTEVSPNPISIDSRSESNGTNAGAGGNIRINQTSGGNFTAGGAINSFSSAIDVTGIGSLNGGNISISAQTIAVDTIDSYAAVSSGSSGNGGAINLTANNNITATSLLESSSFSGAGGNIRLTATNGNIRLLDGLFSGSNSGTSGTINLTAGRDVTASSGISSLSTLGTSGTINLTAGGDITTSYLAAESSFGNGAAINLTANGNITNTFPLGFYSYSGSTGNGGAINLTAGANINISSLDSYSRFGNGGTVSINAPNGSINLTYIDTQSLNGGAGNGGSITIITGNTFLASGNFSARDSTQSSISTQGGAGGGAITITHGGSTSIPFVVGNATSNGTAAAITSGTGANTINNLTVPVPPDVNNYGTNISIRTTAPTVIPPEILILLTTPPPPPIPPAVLVGTPPPVQAEPIPGNPVVLANNPPLTPPSPPVVISPVVINSPSSPPSIPAIISPVEPLPIPSPNPQPSRPNLEATSPGVQPSLGGGSNANSSIPILERIPIDSLGNSLRLLDQSFKEEFQAFTGVGDEIATLDVSQAQNILNRIIRETNTKPVFVYVFFSPLNELTTTPRTTNSSRAGILRTPQDTDTLEIVLVPPNGDLIRVKYPNLPRSEVLQIAGEFTRGIARRNIVYARASKRMYELLISPLEEDLKRLKIDNLVFLMDAGLRSMPIAAMQNKDNRFIIEDYSVGLMPSLTLTDTTYSSLKDVQVMAMGADRFVAEKPLPGVTVELSAINQIRGGNIFLNENFTLSNLRQNRRPEQRIVHLATHGSFSGDKTTSYIQLWGTERLTLDQIRTSGFGTPPVDLLVLSACESALGDRESELGFAGLAVISGVRSAIASLWQVSDEGTMGLMTEFYQQLQTTTTKSEALRQAQLTMLRGEVRLEGGYLVTPKGNFALNEELQRLGDRTLNHPFFWSAFTMIGNPW